MNLFELKKQIDEVNTEYFNLQVFNKMLKT